MADIFTLEPPPPKRMNPWLSMWTQPRATMRQILDTNPDRLVHVLMVIGGIVGALTRAASRNAGDEMSLGVLWSVYGVVGAIGGLVTLYIGGGILTWSGSWLGGRGNFQQIRAALAWAQVPVVWALILLVIELAVFGQEMYTSKAPTIESNPGLVVTLMLIEVIVAIWGLVILVKCLAEAHGFSDTKALGSIILAGSVTTILLYLVEALVTGFVAAVGLS